MFVTHSTNSIPGKFMQSKVTSLSFEGDSLLFDDHSKPKVWKLGQFKHQQLFSFNLPIPSFMPQEFKRSVGYVLERSKLRLRASYVDKYSRYKVSKEQRITVKVVS